MLIHEYNHIFLQFHFSALNKTTNTTKCNHAVIILQPNTYDKKGYVYFNQNWFYKRCSKFIHKRYSKLVSRVLLKTDPQTLLKIGFTSVTRNRPKTLLKLIHRCYSNWPTNVTPIDPEMLLKIYPQTLFKIGSTSVTRNIPTNVTQIDPLVLLKLTYKRYSNWLTGVTQNRPTNVTQNRPINVTQNIPTNVTQINPLLQTLLKIGSTSVSWNRPTNITQINLQVLLKLTHKHYSDWSTLLLKIDPQTLLKIDPQTLLKIGFPSSTKLKNLLWRTAQLKL